ncbi:class I SAM-dependent methyltransferase [Tengunoibacter tsumagoiensis]|uniref:Methyltransferase type 11 domain-containing protein n=1 Tax=Tengunoibacter tsumagoiensis TaxID=2014871 RepID=A0A402A9M2_9CHLR|nr:class I SAM-dependent methyltransferase [Tengunoibacter tsumagoiensis]GCE15706.1 hypothetical protein KTT_55650 [Tengunoibacter tsumagoiensis]
MSMNNLPIFATFSERLSQQRILHLEHLQSISPTLYNCIDLEKIPAADALYEATETVDFRPEAQGGRGESYRLAQKNPHVRLVGIHQLFQLASPDNSIHSFPPNYTILDVLGGDGTLFRALASLLPSHQMPAILTSDIDEGMVQSSCQYGLASIRQSAQHLVIKDDSFDAVIIAYGSHHIPQEQRLQVCKEAWRILKPGGKFILHDFEQASPVAQWFEQVVHPYSVMGHDYAHFTRAEITGYLQQAGFHTFDVHYMYDPFILKGDSAAQVKDILGQHLFNMYGLVGIEQPFQETAYHLARHYFQYDYTALALPSTFGRSEVSIYETEQGWQIEMPRVALVGLAQKAF